MARRMADGDFIDYLVAHGAYAEAARVAAERGELRRAVAWYRRAGAPFDEARVLIQAGALREAGLIYERLVAEGTGDEAATARLALGRLLARLGRPEEAARQLQAAARVPDLEAAAWR